MITFLSVDISQPSWLSRLFMGWSFSFSWHIRSSIGSRSVNIPPGDIGWYWKSGSSWWEACFAACLLDGFWIYLTLTHCVSLVAHHCHRSWRTWFLFFNFFAPRGIQSHFMIYCWFESLDMRTYCPYYRLQLPLVKGSIAKLRSSLSFKKGKKNLIWFFHNHASPASSGSMWVDLGPSNIAVILDEEKAWFFSEHPGKGFSPGLGRS